ncbi:hypothetical protein E1A91_D09G018200v1 [Gossypium mustelinum]|uniref:Uncharacterized protein n=1 Tax=Gossypium mustelinum TaxID=34275 RepID=A0A5D2TGX9_GOSMU|nr:hypothetical protein E1A91_D09G018200v1 [Gossypium mustelinum]
MSVTFFYFISFLLPCAFLVIQSLFLFHYFVLITFVLEICDLPSALLICHICSYSQHPEEFRQEFKLKGRKLLIG